MHRNRRNRGRYRREALMAAVLDAPHRVVDLSQKLLAALEQRTEALVGQVVDLKFGLQSQIMENFPNEGVVTGETRVVLAALSDRLQMRLLHTGFLVGLLYWLRAGSVPNGKNKVGPELAPKGQGKLILALSVGPLGQ